MQIGIALPQIGPSASPEAIVRVAQEAERMDYASVWVLERLLRPTHAVAGFGGPPAPMPDYYATVYDPIETLTYVAAKTERIKLGTSIINALFHTPVILARRFATLDRFSNGRVIAGLGQGWLEDEFETSNVPLKRRGAGMEEFVAAMRAAWGPDPVQFSGRFYRISESQIGPKPVQAGGPPILLGSFAPAALERAVRIADGINPSAWSWEMLDQTVTAYRKQVQEAGKPVDKALVVVRANGQLSKQPVPDPRPILSGSIEQIQEDLARLRSMNVDHIFFDMNSSETPPTIDEQLRLLEQLRAAAV